MPDIGNKLSANPAAWKLVDDASQNQVATSMGGTIVAPSAGWLTALGVWARTVNGAPKAYLAAWKNAANGAPDTLLGRTALLTITTSGANNEGAVADAATEVVTAIRVEAGQVVHLGWKLEGGDAEIGRAGGTVPVYTRTVGGGLPTSPFTHGASGNEQGLAFYATFVADAAPNAPTSLTPASGSNTNNTTPTLGATFSDPNTAPPTSDQLWAYEFEVRNNATDALLWGGPTALFAANASEQAAGVYSRAYNGTALTAGTVIKWRTRTFDLTGAAGAWSGYATLTINANAAVSMSAPTGKIDGPTGEIDFAGTYTHPSLTSSSHVQVRILKDGLVYKEGAEVAKVVAHGAGFTLDGPTEAGVGLLGAGLALQAQGRAKASGIWGDWSAPLSFSTNAIPSVPSALQPPSGTASTTRPLVTFTSADADASDVEGIDVTAELEVTRPDLSVSVYTVSAYDAAAGEFSLQMTTTHMPATGQHKLRARARDVSASDGYSAWSDYSTFTYDAGLVVTVTAPTEGQVLATATPTVTFTIGAGTLVSKRLVVYLKDTTTAVYDSGVLSSAVASFDVPDAALLNTLAYDLTVWAQNDAAASGWSSRRQFSVSFVAPLAVSAPSASAYTHPRDPSPTAVLFSWAASQLPLDQFGGYLVRRRKSGQSLAQATLLKKIPNVAQNRWLDDNAPADAPYVWSVSVLKKQGAQTVESAVVEAEFDLDLAVVVIHAADGSGKRAILRYRPAKRRGTPQQDGAVYPTWGTGGKPTAVFGAGTQQVVDASFTVVGDTLADKDAHFNALNELWLARGPVVYRDERLRFFGRIESFSWEEEEFKDTVQLRIEEVYFVEGE